MSPHYIPQQEKTLDTSLLYILEHKEPMGPFHPFILHTGGIHGHISIIHWATWGDNGYITSYIPQKEESTDTWSSYTLQWEEAMSRHIHTYISQQEDIMDTFSKRGGGGEGINKYMHFLTFPNRKKSWTHFPLYS